MNPKQLQDDFPEVQTAIYRVALSLDSFLLNGIPYGVIHRDFFNGFLEKTASNLLTELASLEQAASHIPAIHPTKVTAVLASLRARCQQLIDLLTKLSSFKVLSPKELRFGVSQIPLLRGECVQLIQELEVCFRTPKPFYESRPNHSTAAVDAFLTNLERMFAEERTASNIGGG